MTKNKHTIKILYPILLACLVCSGCSTENNQEPKAEVKVSDYTKITYDTVEAAVGDITPVLSLKLTGDEYEKVNYFPFKDGLQVENVNVSRGDMVSKGDVLVTFKSEELSEELESYKTRIDEDKMLLEHYNNLAAIDTANDYQSQIQEVNGDLEVAEMYVSELETTIESYYIRAEANGVVTMVSQLLSYGEVNASDNILTVTYGSGSYVAVTDASDRDLFNLGDVHEASYGNTCYDMVVTDIQEEDDSLTLTFNLSGDEGRLLEYNSLNMKIDKNTMSDVLYVPTDAVFNVDGTSYVYILDDDGFRHGVKVETVCDVDGNTVISNGISEGDRVVITK